MLATLPTQVRSETLWQDFTPPSFSPPSPVLFPRRNLDQRFAVLLMRSSYDAADDLDFVPMVCT